MTETIQYFIEMCQWDAAKYLIISDNVFVPLIYYSHFLALIPALLLGFYILHNNSRSIVNRLFFTMSVFFAIWVYSDLVLWGSEIPSYIMFFWTLLVIFEPLIYITAVLFFYSFINNKLPSFKWLLTLLVLILPTLLFAHTNWGLIGFDLTNCDRAATEGPLATYGYAMEIIMAAAIAILAFRKLGSNRENRGSISLIAVGLIFFLLSFASGNIAEVFTENWYIGQIGLIGMPVFLALLAYTISKYKAFNIKLLWAQVLVFFLGLSVMGLLFVRTIENVRIITSVTLIFVLLSGISLVRSVKKEVAQREKIEKLAGELKVANDRLRELDRQKSEFLSFASHQLRSPLTAIKGYASLILEGSFGPLTETLKEAVDRVFQSTQGMVLMVEDFLNISRIEQGRMKYEMTDLDLKAFAEELTAEMLPVANKKGLELKFNGTKETLKVSADPGKLRQVIANLIDNSIKYTPSGSVEVTVKNISNKAQVVVADTGVGISKEEISHLFEKFGRAKNANKVNVTGTGLGLYLAKMIVEAHQGKVWAESEGEGKGSRFIVELPLK